MTEESRKNSLPIMTIEEKVKRISNGYYNEGLKKAVERDLTRAAGLLKEALRFDKSNIDARNLLGLIYYEMGETADALCQWVISMNISPVNNRADKYLEEVQRRTGELEKASAKIKKFNLALNHAMNNGEDFAILQLQYLVGEHPGYVKAQLLLALLYLNADDTRRAGRALLEVLKTDRFNPQGLRLFDELKKRTGKDEAEKKKYAALFSSRKIEDTEVIIPESGKELVSSQIILYLCIGIAVGILFFRVLLLPPVEKKYIENYNRQVVENGRELSDINARYADLSERYDELSSNYSEISKRLYSFEQGNADFTSMYQKLSSIKYNYDTGNIETAVRDYMEIDRNLVADEPLAGLYTDIDRVMKNQAFDEIVSQGTDNWNASKKSRAEELYDLALSIKPGDPETLYLKGRLLQSSGRVNEANSIFDIIVGEHPESPYAERAIAARGY